MDQAAVYGRRRPLSPPIVHCPLSFETHIVLLPCLLPACTLLASAWKRFRGNSLSTGNPVRRRHSVTHSNAQMSRLVPPVNTEDDPAASGDVLGPLLSPAYSAKSIKSTYRLSSTEDLDEGGEGVLSPHIHGTRRLPKTTSRGSNFPTSSSTLTQHIRHRSSLFWLQNNSFANVEEFDESNWDAESFITKRKELQFALEKLPVFNPNVARIPPSFDLLTAKLAQEEDDYENEVNELLRKRQLQRAFAAWVAVKAWKPRQRAQEAANNKKKKQSKKLRKVMSTPPVSSPSATLEPRREYSSSSNASTTMDFASTSLGGDEVEEEGDEGKLAILEAPHPLLVPINEYVGPEFVALEADEGETLLPGEDLSRPPSPPVLPPPTSTTTPPPRSTVVSRMLAFRTQMQEKSRPISSRVLQRAVSALSPSTRMSTPGSGS
ncbi:hypothetical protein BASA81_001115 [Batrachochytrium salamandrivorans]|nr:hypothetical protein BASA81_001115 [Batrachochytrium salamandrivorans]